MSRRINGIIFLNDHKYSAWRKYENRRHNCLDHNWIINNRINIYTGWYNVSGMNQDTGISKWLLNTTKENSIEFRSVDIKVPNLNDSSLIEMGFSHYKEMCESCHAAPGKGETELAKGLNPPAPKLYKIAEYLSPKEIFWVTKNGIKMTGMPAWGKTHSDAKIWAITAAVKKLPELTSAKYDSLGNEDDDE